MRKTIAALLVLLFVGSVFAASIAADTSLSADAANPTTDSVIASDANPPIVATGQATVSVNDATVTANAIATVPIGVVSQPMPPAAITATTIVPATFTVVHSHLTGEKQGGSTITGWKKGDINNDGIVNAFDIEPFTKVLRNPWYYMIFHYQMYWSADTTTDNRVNWKDVDPFTQLLIEG